MLKVMLKDKQGSGRIAKISTCSIIKTFHVHLLREKGRAYDTHQPECHINKLFFFSIICNILLHRQGTTASLNKKFSKTK